MENELKSAIQESLPEDVNEAASSVADDGKDPSVPAETPAQQVEQEKEPPFHNHPRWQEQQTKLKEVQNKQDRLEKENEYLKQLYLKTIDNKQQGQPQVDPYAGMDNETKAFYERIDKLAEAKARKVIDEVKPQFENELKQQRETLAAIAYERFQAQHPDVKAGSTEESQIADYFLKGYNLEDAYKIVMFPKMTEKRAEEVKTKVIEKTQAKKAANLETTNIPAISGIKAKNNFSFREMLSKEMDKAGF